METSLTKYQMSSINHSDWQRSNESQPNAETSTSSQTDLDISSSKANKYKCPFCPKKTTGYNYLMVHVVTIHYAKELSVEKSQTQCHICEKSFSTNSNMVNIYRQSPIFLPLTKSLF